MDKRIVFKKVYDASVIEDVQGYLQDFLSKNKGTKIAVGTDSLEHKRTVVYATIIALFHPSIDKAGVITYHKGAHLIYTKKKVKGKIDMWNRLWNEVEMTREVAEFIGEDVLNSNGWDKEVEIHLDINPDEKWDSNKLFASAVGMFEGLGYSVVVKPYGWVASSAADVLCR